MLSGDLEVSGEEARDCEFRSGEGDCGSSGVGRGGDGTGLAAPWWEVDGQGGARGCCCDDGESEGSGGETAYVEDEA